MILIEVIGAEIAGKQTVNGTTAGIGIVTTRYYIYKYSWLWYNNHPTFYENSNFFTDTRINHRNVNKIFKFDTSSISGSMFSIKYQLFLNDLYYFNSVELLQYSQ